MTRVPKTRGRRFASLAVVLAAACVCAAQPPASAPAAASPVPESEIASLAAELAHPAAGKSTVEVRMACKSLVRRGKAILEAHPSAPNRYRVLGIVFQGQKRLLSLESSERNRGELLDTCKELAQAPDEYAELRLEADLLLSDRDLTARDAALDERVKALAALVDRYRGTPAEAKSLMMAALIAPKLEAFDLQDEILDTLAERFAGDPVVIEWRRKNFGISNLDLLFAGTFTRADGVSLSFPMDAMGHTCLMYFWSKETPDIEKQLAAVKELQSRYPGQLDIYSFNLDRLPDAGEKTLRALGLNWTALRLPEGRQSQVYRTYATRDPLSLRVNAHGHAFTVPTFISELAKIKDSPGNHAYGETPLEQSLDDARYLAQLQSLFIGDFLVADAGMEDKPSRTAESVPADTLGAIRACFIPPPFRYRLTTAEALAHYTKAEKLCRDAIEKHPKAPDLWMVCNGRIIALLGMWNLATEPMYLEDAARQSRAALTARLPRGADVVPRFCLAKEALRQGDRDRQSVLAAFLEAAGGAGAPASAYAAAAILAMEANERGLHSRYREILLKEQNDNPTLWPVISFLRDQNHIIRLFRANYYHPPSQTRRADRAGLRHNAATQDAAGDANRPLKADLIALTGGTWSLPQATEGNLTLLMFVEPPADPSADFPVAINGSVTEDSRGKKIQTAGMMQRAFQLADEHADKKVKVIAAFLCDDAARVKALMDKCKWPCQAVMVPGGLKNPLVRRLGILSADRVPNVALLRGDGTIAWTISGIVHPQLRSEGIGELMHVIDLGMSANVNSCEMEVALQAMKQGRLQEAVRLFSPPSQPAGKKPSFDEWSAPRLHGRALACVGLKNWEAALADIDAAIEAHQIVVNYKNPCTCSCVAGMRLVRATILDQLGRKEEAQAERKAAAGASSAHRATRYGAFHDQLNALNMKAER